MKFSDLPPGVSQFDENINPSGEFDVAEEFDVYLLGVLIQQVTYEGMSADDVKNLLIEEEMFDPRITVVQVTDNAGNADDN